MNLILTVRIVGESTALEETLTPNLSELSLQSQIKVEVADKVIDLVPNTAVVAVGVVAIVDDVADLCHVVGIVEVHLTFIGFQILCILVDVIVVVAAQQVIDTLIIMRPRSTYG